MSNSEEYPPDLVGILVKDRDALRREVCDLRARVYADPDRYQFLGEDLALFEYRAALRAEARARGWRYLYDEGLEGEPEELLNLADRGTLTLPEILALFPKDQHARIRHNIECLTELGALRFDVKMRVVRTPRSWP